LKSIGDIKSNINSVIRNLNLERDNDNLEIEQDYGGKMRMSKVTHLKLNGVQKEVLVS
jgi:hypothetical protein